MDDGLPCVVRFVVTLYDRTMDAGCGVLECRRSLFTKKDRQPKSLPPIPDALKQYSLRAGFRGSLVWGLCPQPIRDLPDPSAWGWKRNSNGWGPVWITIPVVQASLALLISCG